eukprot:jgi/Bigna1/78230/fgenesh1_pg.53_\
MTILLILLFSPLALGHSWLACVDYEPVTGTCRGYARNWFNVMGGAAFFTDRGRDNRPGIDFPEGLVCDQRKEARTNPVEAAYDEDFPMAVLRIGDTVTWRWPAKNHATVGVQRGVQVFITDAPNLSEDRFRPEPIAEMDFSNCNPRRANVDSADCQDRWMVPRDIRPGLHTLMWWFNLKKDRLIEDCLTQGEFYNSCADVYIVAEGADFPTFAPVPPTLEPTISPTGENGGPGCCSWSGCNVCEPTGPFCLESASNCENNCAHNSRDGSISDARADCFCSVPNDFRRLCVLQLVALSKCLKMKGVNEPTSTFCLLSEFNCEGPCNGMWFTSGIGNPVPDPTFRPTPPRGYQLSSRPSRPPRRMGAAGRNACWTQCGECQPTSEYCLRNEANCEGPCNGMWCPVGPDSVVSTIQTAGSSTATTQDFVQILCPPIAIPPSGSFQVEILATTTADRVIGVDVVREGAGEVTTGRGSVPITSTNGSPMTFVVDIQITREIERPTMIEMQQDSTHLLAAWIVERSLFDDGLLQPWLNSTASLFEPVLVDTLTSSPLCDSRAENPTEDTSNSSDEGGPSDAAVIAVSVIFTLLAVAAAVGAFVYFGAMQSSGYSA